MNLDKLNEILYGEISNFLDISKEDVRSYLEMDYKKAITNYVSNHHLKNLDNLSNEEIKSLLSKSEKGREWLSVNHRSLELDKRINKSIISAGMSGNLRD